MSAYLLVAFVICYFSYEYLYFSIGEAALMGISVCLSFSYLKSWYVRVAHTTRFFNEYGKRMFLYFLPFTTVLLYMVTLRTAASFDVVDDGAYILLYLLLGIVWQYAGLQGMFLFFDFSYRDDVLIGNSVPALLLFSFAYPALALIYAGANVGDGPGWWTVVFAGGLGTLAWLLSGAIVNKATGIIERIVMDKERHSAVRFGCFLLACGVILARASSGDWTSFTVTVIEFMTGWPVILLVLGAIVAEHVLFRPQEAWDGDDNAGVKTAVVSACYLIYAGAAVWPAALGLWRQIM